jgi:uncharacterized protein YfbU (UPF0304 family)
MGFDLNDHAYKAVLQILKYHCNELQLPSLIAIKEDLQFLKSKIGYKEGASEYVDNMDKVLSLAVQIKFENLKTSTEAVNLLRLFLNDFSATNFEKILNFVHKNPFDLDLKSLLHLLEIMNAKSYFHLSLLKKLGDMLVIVKEKQVRYELSHSEINHHNHLLEVYSIYLTSVVRNILKLKYHSIRLFQFIANTQLAHLKKSIHTTDKLESNLAMVDALLEACIFFQHKRVDLVEFLHTTKLSQEKCLLKTEKFPLIRFLIYSSMINYQGFKILR